MQNKEQFIYTGIPTFMGGNCIEEKDIEKYEVIFLGIPTDYGASYRLGAKYAPRKLRELSFWLRMDGSEMYDMDLAERMTGNSLSIADLGDIDVDPTNPDHNQNNIRNAVYKIREKCFPLVCGGDHSITYGSFLGCFQAIKETYPNYEIGIIHFDAHLDVEDKYLNMPNVWHGNVIRKIIEDGYLKGENLYTIGPHGLEYYEYIKYIREHKINLYTTMEIRKKGIQNVVAEILERNYYKKIKFYITFDVDVLDMAYLQGTGIPQQGGLLPNEINYFMRGLKDLDVVGLDIVELNSILDCSDNSFVVASEILYNYLAFGYNK